MAYILPVTTDPSPAPTGKVKIVALVDGLYIVDAQGTLTGPFGPAGAGSGDMLKTTYDADDDGFVDVAEGLRETSGLTTLTVSGVGNGQYLKRDGTTIVGDSPAATGDMNQTEYDTNDDGTVNSASGLKEISGPTVLMMGAVADGQFLKRSGNEVVGGTPAGAGDMEQTTYDQNQNGVVDDSEKLAGVTPTAAGLALLDDADVIAQRNTLGLGDSATKDVGTVTGTVAAGDHNHAGVYEPADATILKDADISVTVAAEGHDHDGTYATLDGNGKIPVSQLPSSVMEYKGVWDASTNSPALSDGTGDQGDVYRVTVAGTQDLGSGNITFNVGDYVIYNGSIWEKSDTTDAVSSVDSQTGDVDLSGTYADISHTHDASEVGAQEFVLQWVIGNGVDVITTATPVFPQEVPADATIVGWTIYAPKESGSIVLDVWVDDYDHLPLTGVDSICGAGKATLSSAQTAQDLTVSTWDPYLEKGYWMQPEIESASTVTLVVLSIRLERS